MAGPGVAKAGVPQSAGDVMTLEAEPSPLPAGACYTVPAVPLAGAPGTAPGAGAPRTTLAAGAPRTAPAPGPVLGRSVVVGPGQEPPPAWRHCERARAATVDELERAWRERTPLVIELEHEPPEAEVERSPVWSLSASFSFRGERLAHALFSNSVDARDGRPTWWLADEAIRLGASAGGPADVLLPGGEPVFCDGGPLGWRGPLGWHGLLGWHGPLDHDAGSGSDPGGPAGRAAVLHRVALLAGSLVPFGPNQTAAELAPDQLAAVTHPGGAARVVAPAGSGKTRVLTERARHLLRHWHLPGGAVTLVAFNKKAAVEMRERTPELPQLRVRTLNALGLALVTGSEEVATIEEREVRSLLAGLVDLPRRTNTDPAASWLEALSAVRLGLRSPKEVEAEFGGDVDGLPEVFERYRRLLADRGQVDFDEQVYRAIEILLTDPGARRRARAGCRVLLVDEFQDLTPAHVLLVRLLAGPDGAVFGVGDDDQTIYGYSGASPEWLVGFRRFFPSAGEHALEVNYRCPPKVVEGARNLLAHNRHRVDKTIVAAPGRAAAGPELEVVAAGEGALAHTVATVEALLAGGATPSDVAVLSRVNSSLAGVQVALVHREVPVQPAVDVTYLSRSGVQAALAWLRLASAPAGRLNGRDLAVAAKRPSRGLAPRVVEWMAEQPSIPKLKALAGRLSSRDGDKVAAFLADLELVRARAEAGTVAATLRAVRDQVGLDRAMELLDSSRRRLDRSAQTDDLDALVALAALHPASEGFEEWLRESLRHPGSAGGVVLSTVHRVKGREWPHVVLHEVTDGLFPHRLAEDVEEERRVFHVGLTRCSVSVHLVTGDPPSPFVDELRGRSVPAARRPEGDRRRAASTASQRPGQPRRGTQPPPEVVERVRRSLRAWRSERAAREKKPAYVFLHDRTLEALAQAAPASMTALARVQGIGPAKLEAYGDELLALISEAVTGPPG